MEILLVLLIVGLASAVAMLSMPADDASKSARAAAERFSRVAQLAVEQSILSGEIWGLVLLQADAQQSRRYQWRRWRDGEWQVHEDLFPVESLPAGNAVQFTVDGESVQWPLAVDTAVPAFAAAGAGKEQPLALVYPGGEATPLVLSLQPEGETVAGLELASTIVDGQWQRVSISAAGQILWQNHD